MQGHLQLSADLIPDAWSDRLGTVHARKPHLVCSPAERACRRAGVAVYLVVQRLPEERRMTKNLAVNAPPVGTAGALVE